MLLNTYGIDFGTSNIAVIVALIGPFNNLKSLYLSINVHFTKVS